MSAIVISVGGDPFQVQTDPLEWTSCSPALYPLVWLLVWCLLKQLSAVKCLSPFFYQPEQSDLKPFNVHYTYQTRLLEESPAGTTRYLWDKVGMLYENRSLKLLPIVSRLNEWLSHRHTVTGTFLL